MPLKRGKRGRPKKVKTDEEEEVVALAETDISSMVPDNPCEDEDEATAAAVQSIIDNCFEEVDEVSDPISDVPDKVPDAEESDKAPDLEESEKTSDADEPNVIPDIEESNTAMDFEEATPVIEVKGIESLKEESVEEEAPVIKGEEYSSDDIVEKILEPEEISQKTITAEQVAEEGVPCDLDGKNVKPVDHPKESDLTATYLSNIDNMESMEDDEGFAFKGLDDTIDLKDIPQEDKMVVDRDIQVCASNSEGSAKYDPSNEDTVEEPMESEDMGKGDDKHEGEVKHLLEPETEIVSEDELPTETTKLPSDTEAVSDEELPPKNGADALLDTEAVSEDELPPLKKKKVEADEESNKKVSSTEEVTHQKLPPKRSSSAVSEPNEGAPSNKKSSVEPKSSTKTLLELDKYWKAVKEDPSDFTGWTYLLQYVDQGQDVEAAREAYDAFLSHYPYCYGYWRKYADYEKKKGDKTKSQDVFERGLAAIPLSVDLWLHYLNHIKNTRKDDEDYIREQYNRAIDFCGIEFRSDRLWDGYIKWETECKNISNVFSVYDKLLTIPTQGYKSHFENFIDFVKANQPNKMLGVDEFLSIRAEVLQKLKQKGGSETAPAANAPPGDESDEETEKSPNFADEETKLMRDKIISLRTKTFKTMSNAVLDRWNYEEGIKRPYFHVKPLERCQLNNWRAYLDYEIGQGDRDRIIVLFERCLIACALYDEFWMKYIKFLETLSSSEIRGRIREVYQRACTIHHPKKPMLALNWASFEENEGNIDGARQVLIRLEKEVPNSLQISINRINLERRAKNCDEVSKLYEHYIGTNKNKFTTNALSIKYARFCQKILNDIDKGSEVLRKAIEKDKDNPRLYHQLLDLVFSKTPRGPEQEEECVGIINQFLDRESTDLEHKLLFAQHKVEFLEDFGCSMINVQKAVTDYIGLLKQVKEKRRKQFEDKIKSDDKKTKTDGSTTHSASTPSNGNNGGYQSNYPAGQQPYQNNSNQYQQQAPPNYSQPPYNQYSNQSDPNYNNYQNWNYQQTSGYNNYNQGWSNYNYY